MSGRWMSPAEYLAELVERAAAGNHAAAREVEAWKRTIGTSNVWLEVVEGEHGERPSPPEPRLPFSESA